MSEENNKTGADLANAAKDFAHAEEQLQRMIEDLIKVQSREKNLRSAVEALEEVKAALLSASLRFGELSSKSQSALDEIGRLISVIQGSDIGKVVEELNQLKQQFSNYEKSIDKKFEDLISQNSNLGNKIERAIATAVTKQSELLEENSESIESKFESFEKKMNSSFTNILASVWAVGILLALFIAAPR